MVLVVCIDDYRHPTAVPNPELLALALAEYVTMFSFIIKALLASLDAMFCVLCLMVCVSHANQSDFINSHSMSAGFL